MPLNGTSFCTVTTCTNKSLTPHHPLRSLPVRQRYIILQNDCKNQPTRLRQPTIEIANQRLFRTRQNASFGLQVNGTPWERLATLTCKGMLSYCNPLLLSTPLQLTATLGLQPHLTDVSAGVMQNLNTNDVQFMTAHLHRKAPLQSDRSLRGCAPACSCRSIQGFL